VPSAVLSKLGRGVTEISRATVERVGAEMLRAEGPDVVLLLGAGASRKSGVSTADQIAEWACRWAYCRKIGRSERDPTVVRSDWWSWLERERWFVRERPLVDQYPQIIEELVQPREARREFFLDIVNRRVEPSRGYEALADLTAEGWLKTILTVNFDGLIYEALSRRTRPRHVTVIRVPSDAHAVSTAPRMPQIVHLHGVVEYYADQNLEEETQHISPELRAAVMPILRDHPLVVIGYRGAEASIMHDLLRDGAKESFNFRRGIYWCVREREIDSLHSYVEELAGTVGKNFQLVPIEGFDECVEAWATSARELAPPRRRAVEAAPEVADLAPVVGENLDALDWDLIGSRVTAYARRTGIAVPAEVTRSWLIARMKSADLLCVRDGRVAPTRAGQLLFATTPVTRMELESEAGKSVIEGNLFQVLDEAGEALDDENRAFTLKGETSEVVRPYPPLALKELVVNALAHRDHGRAEPVLIEVDAEAIRIESPGGVVPSVDPERLGERGVKGYRNPVVADLLYGAGAMEKEGSGLADVIALAAEVGGSVSLTTAPENARFIAVIRPRPERPDELTRTAHAALSRQRFLTNVVPVSLRAESVYLGATNVSGYRDLRERHAGVQLPPYALHEGCIVSFSRLDDDENALAADVVDGVEEHAISDFFSDPDRERILVQLLNEGLKVHAMRLGLVVLPRDQRIYFPSDEGEGREISYKARVRRAKRTVTKPIVSKASGVTRYWEHEAVGYRFRRFGEEWGLMLVPGWLFTHDGKRKLLKGPRVGPLTTRRAARDYNPQVANDLIFWLATLTEGQPTRILDDDTGAIELGQKLVAVEVANAPAAPGADDVVSIDADESEEPDQELAAIASEAQTQ
jgi:hypothetical protein